MKNNKIQKNYTNGPLNFFDAVFTPDIFIAIFLYVPVLLPFNYIAPHNYFTSAPH